MTGFEPVLNETALRTEPQPLLSVQNQTNCESWDEVDWLDRLNFVCFNKKKWVASKYSTSAASVVVSANGNLLEMKFYATIN